MGILRKRLEKALEIAKTQGNARNKRKLKALLKNPRKITRADVLLISSVIKGEKK